MSSALCTRGRVEGGAMEREPAPVTSCSNRHRAGDILAAAATSLDPGHDGQRPSRLKLKFLSFGRCSRTRGWRRGASSGRSTKWSATGIDPGRDGRRRSRSSSTLSGGVAGRGGGGAVRAAEDRQSGAQRRCNDLQGRICGIGSVARGQPFPSLGGINWHLYRCYADGIAPTHLGSVDTKRGYPGNQRSPSTTKFLILLIEGNKAGHCDGDLPEEYMLRETRLKLFGKTVIIPDPKKSSFLG